MNQQTADAILDKWHKHIQPEQRRFFSDFIYSLVSEDVGEVHAWNRPLTVQEINERFELQRKGEISISTCNCNICKRERTEITKQKVLEFYAADPLPDKKELYTLQDFQYWVISEDD